MTDYKQWQRENWDRAHRESDITALTGTGLGGHLTALGTAELLMPLSTVLCIGVGMGDWVRDAALWAAETWALDISPVAGARMPVGVRFVTDARELPSDHFDLAMSLWVAPHMTDHDVEEQLAEVIRSLKPTGIFALHYKEPLVDSATVDNREGAEDEYRRAEGAMMLRRRRHFAAMVQWAGGHVDRIAMEYPSQFWQIIEVSIHIGKGTKGNGVALRRT